jgi:hypothetical protein
MTFQSTKWTSTVPTPFGPAPGAGLGVMRRKLANVNYDRGFAVSGLGEEYVLPDEILRVKGPFTVSEQPVMAGQVPAALLQLVFTDRGAANQGALDQGIYTMLGANGFRLSNATRFYPIDVTWVWRKQPAPDKTSPALYFPVVANPPGTQGAMLNGMVYSGSAISTAQLMDAHFMPTPELLAKLPKQVWLYSFAITGPNNQFGAADGAKALTVMKTAWGKTLPDLSASAYGYMTLLGADPSIFEKSSPVPGPMAKSNLWLWLLGTAVVMGYTHFEKPGSRAKAWARRWTP